MRILLTIAAVLTALVVYASRSARAAEPPFRDLAFADALAAAKAEGKVVMVDFFTTWCVPCKRLDKVTWKDPEVVAWLERRTVPLKVDAEKETELAGRFAVEAYPTIVFAGADGSALGKLVGYYEPKDFLTMAERVSSVASSGDGAQDPAAREERAAAAVREERWEDALEAVLFCLDDQGEADPTYDPLAPGGVGGLLEPLASAYPPAAEALRARAEALAQRVRGGELDGVALVEALGRLVALDEALGEDERTLAVYADLRAQRPGQAVPVVLFRAVMPQLVAAKRYAEVLEGVGDVEQLVVAQLTAFGRMAERITGTEGGEAMLARLRRRAVTELVGPYEALAGLGEDAAAERVADRLIAFDPSVETIEDLLRAAMRAEAYAACYAIVDKGEAALPESATPRLRELRAKLPLGPPTPVRRPRGG